MPQVDIEPASEPRRELWFEDGNIILQAGNSQFRVYRGILAARSPIFQDMLSFPQPAESELLEGCPLVHLPDDETKVTHFLKAVYLPAFPAFTTLDIIAGCVRLAHKYEVDYLRRRGFVHLASEYPTTLAGGTLRWPVPYSISPTAPYPKLQPLFYHPCSRGGGAMAAV
ncbi:hypothetical protein B0H17DRAFT_1011892 [Mycena rosella]|uniref:BTB domain-containing protein n=1 Tax=Mycena rosella TaxID=1033263 RepID=A0AAD7DGP5_MYCRO|nr:hypothetical protein B0H17DRAFT_1011892 [Mycena rosella]